MRAQLRNERGKVVRYISVAGEQSKSDTLDSKSFLKTRGWRLAQEQDGQNGQGNGVGGWGHKHAANNAPAPMNTPPRRNWRQAEWAFVNCQGVSSKVEELEEMLHREKFGILGLAETWLRAEQSLELERYNWFGVEMEGTGTRRE